MFEFQFRVEHEPVGNLVANAKRSNKKDVIETFQVGNMLVAQGKINIEIAHAGTNINLNFSIAVKKRKEYLCFFLKIFEDT